MIPELSTELNSEDLRRLAGKEWLNDKVNHLQFQNDCFAVLLAVPLYNLLDPQIMMKYLHLLQSEAERVRLKN